MEVYTIGFTQKTASDFFSALVNVGIKRLLDVRVHNESQLAGFTKRADLEYFLAKLCAAEYVHVPLLAPTAELLSAYRKKKLSWQEYEHSFLSLMSERRIETQVSKDLLNGPTVLLCSEPTTSKCHRRLVLEYLNSKGYSLRIRDL
jgi:uncharacterized protein (DUF488 family)